MKLRLIMADPAGNRTALVLTRVPREDYAPLAAELLARELGRSPGEVDQDGPGSPLVGGGAL